MSNPYEEKFDLVSFLCVAAGIVCFYLFLWFGKVQPTLDEKHNSQHTQPNKKDSSSYE